MHVIPDSEDNEDATCTHIPETPNNVSDALHIDSESKMQNKKFNVLPTELTDLPHVIPENRKGTNPTATI